MCAASRWSGGRNRQLAANGIRRLEAGVAGASDDGDVVVRLEMPPDAVPETLVLEKVALPLMLSMTIP